MCKKAREVDRQKETEMERKNEIDRQRGRERSRERERESGGGGGGGGGGGRDERGKKATLRKEGWCGLFREVTSYGRCFSNFFFTHTNNCQIKSSIHPRPIRCHVSIVPLYPYPVTECALSLEHRTDGVAVLHAPLPVHSANHSCTGGEEALLFNGCEGRVVYRHGNWRAAVKRDARRNNDLHFFVVV